MSNEQSYSINIDVKFDALEIIDISKLSAECKEDWFNQSLCIVNDCVVRLGILKGEFHWHQHKDEDEFFFVISGELFIDLEGRSVKLSPLQGFTVPKGIVHKTRAPERTVVLMIEKSTVTPVGD